MTLLSMLVFLILHLLFSHILLISLWNDQNSTLNKVYLIAKRAINSETENVLLCDMIAGMKASPAVNPIRFGHINGI